MIVRKTIRILAIALSFVCLGTGLLQAAEGDVITVTIYNTGDLHDHSQTLAKVAGFVKQERTKDPRVLLVDIGDIFNKGEAAMASTQGEGMIRLMSLVGYDACILGNHDYIYGKDRILELSQKYPAFPLVLCNMKWAEADKEKTKNIVRYKVLDLQGVRVAICGAGSHYLNHSHGTPLPVFSEREAYQQVLPEFKEKADVFVLLSHLFNGSDQGMLQGLGADAPDVLIGGHTHERKVWTVEKTLIVKAGAVGTCLGQTTIRWDPAEKKVVGKSAKVLNIGKDWPESDEVKAARESYFQPAAKKEKAAK